jgi:hypothetical protein
MEKQKLKNFKYDDSDEDEEDEDKAEKQETTEDALPSKNKSHEKKIRAG